MAKKTFRVYPNPFIHIDHDGQPAGVCPCDMIEHVGPTVRKFVGARLDPANTMLLEKLTEEQSRYRDPRQQTRFTFDFSEPTVLVQTEYYRDRLRGGEIVPADKETHLLAGFAAADWREPAEVLRAAKDAALKYWVALHGPGARPEGIDSLDQALAGLGKGQPPEAPAAPPAASAEPFPTVETPAQGPRARRGS